MFYYMSVRFYMIWLERVKFQTCCRNVQEISASNMLYFDLRMLTFVCPCVGPGVCRFRIDPLRFLAGWRKRRLNHAFSFVLV